MSRRNWSRAELAAVALAGSLLCSRCATEHPDIVGPNPASLQISANPTAIPVLGGVSTITVIGLELSETGELVPLDGARIFLTTGVGNIEDQVVMRQGTAQASLRSTGRAGLAAITATADQGGTVTLSPPVLVGNATGLNIVLTATPASVVEPDFTSDLVATAFDNDNNPMPNVPIIFDADGGAVASRGSILRTNVLGQASDRFELRDACDAKIVARSGSVVSNEVTVSRRAPLDGLICPVTLTRSGRP